MKLRIFVLHCILIIPVGSDAGLTVIDPTLIANHRRASQEQLYELILQELNQQTSIAQFADFLERHGSLEEPTAEEAFEALLILINETSQTLPPIEEVTEATIFGGQENTIYDRIEKTVVSDELVIGEVDGNLLRPEAAARSSFAQYEDVQHRIFSQRDELMDALSEATDSLRNATTTAEVQKLTGLILSLQTQLTATEDQLRHAHQAAILRVLENENESSALRKRKEQAEKIRLRHQHNQEVELFRLP